MHSTRVQFYLIFRLGISYIQEAVHNSVSGSFVCSKYNHHNRPVPCSLSVREYNCSGRSSLYECHWLHKWRNLHSRVVIGQAVRALWLVARCILGLSTSECGNWLRLRREKYYRSFNHYAIRPFFVGENISNRKWPARRFRLRAPTESRKSLGET